MASDPPLAVLLDEIRACTLCADLPLGPNPVVRAATSARILIIGQAPGTRVHATSIPWNDPSGDRLRDWMNVDRDTFYDSSRIAIMPMGFCYPGRGRGGDLPPRPECAPAWHAQVLSQLPDIRLILLIGQYAQRYYLGDNFTTVTETVKRAAEMPTPYFPLVHPSPRNTYWLKKNAWFEGEVVPALASKVAEFL